MAQKLIIVLWSWHHYYFSVFLVIDLRPLVEKGLEGGGESGQITCPDGSKVDVTNWGMSLSKNKGEVFGGFNAFFNVFGSFADTSISFNSGTITENKFTASGVGRSNNLCGVPFESISATVKGRCGSGDIQIILGNTRGFVTGTVACNN